MYILNAVIFVVRKLDVVVPVQIVIVWITTSVLSYFIYQLLSRSRLLATVLLGKLSGNAK